MAAAVTGIVAGTVGAAHEIAPKVAADEHLALTPERSAEPVAHGGPLAMPTIGVVATGTSTNIDVTEPVHTLSTTRRGPRTPARTPAPVLSRSVAITATSEPTVTTPTQAATVTPLETTNALTTPPTGADTGVCQLVTAPEQCAAQTVGPDGEPSPSPVGGPTTTATTSSETATATVSVTVTATESTEEGQ